MISGFTVLALLYFDKLQLADANGNIDYEKILPADYRREFVCAHGIALAGLARVGRSLLAQFPKTWPGKLKKLRTLNWRRSNTATWERRAMIAGRLSKASTCVVLTGNALKQTLGLRLSEHENQVEVTLRNPK